MKYSNSKSFINFVPFGTFQSQIIHHECVTGLMRVADGSRYGKITDYGKIKPECCGKCREYCGKQKNCKVGYWVSSFETKACVQGNVRGTRSF